MRISFKKNKFIKVLKECRIDKTQKQLADELGISRSTLSQLENGNLVPKLEILTKILEKTDFKIEDFFVQEKNDPIVLLMGSMSKDDKENMAQVIKRISIRQKYSAIDKRCG